MLLRESYKASPKPFTLKGFLPGLSTLSLMFIGICATTNSGLANALNWTDLTCGVLAPLVDFKTNLPTIYLETSDICFSLSPVPEVCVNALT